MKLFTVLLIIFFSVISIEKEEKIEVIDSGQVLKAQILKAPMTINSEFELITETKFRGCLATWNVTIKRDTEMEGFILSTFGIPAKITTISCSSGGEFICPNCVANEIQVT